jgi:DNA primase
LYSVFRPAKKILAEPEAKPVELPDGFITFDKININYPPHVQAIKYLKSRGVTRDMVLKYKLGLTTNGLFARRIIFPSYDRDNKLNFFVGRTWVSDKPKYLGVDTPKDNIIFNEHLLDWNKDIYIVEGPFDALFVENSIVTLGSHLSKYKIEKIYNNANAII